VSDHTDAKIIDSWHTNAAPWTTAIRESRIESRRLATNQAILDAIASRAPRSLLDVGCGEGWLVREVARDGVRALGVDVVPALIDRASSAGGGEFRVVSYEALAAGALVEKFDVVVANFALLGHESVEGLLRHVPSLLDSRGTFIVQTLHPLVACGDHPYSDGWRDGSWAGFGSEFSDPAPWYFRTTESWIRLLRESGLTLDEVREPLHPLTMKPASIIFMARATGSRHEASARGE
jgi:2-polyprenyl-3-methyl-5-hydroxy-6-metoxy-1,4-benzoquinol methylase